MRLVLVGAGHGHLNALMSLPRIVGRGHEVVLVVPEPFWYSGLATGVLGGLYPASLDRIDVASIARAAGATVIEAAAVAIDPGSRSLMLADGRSVAWDVLSLALGSGPPPLPGAADHPAVHPVKPVARLLALRDILEKAFAEGRHQRVVVAGGGATAIEIAANLAGLASRARGSIAVTVLAGRGVLPKLQPAARGSVLRALDRRAIVVRTGARVVAVEAAHAQIETGERIAFDQFVNATGLVPHPLYRATGLPVDAGGALVTDVHLRSVGNPSVLGAGDGIAVQGHDLDKVGVFAIRQGPVLTANLLAALEGGPLETFRPQRRYLWIMNLGDGTGLAVRGSLWWHGRTAFVLKDRIDRRFLAAHRAGTPA